MVFSSADEEKRSAVSWRVLAVMVAIHVCLLARGAVLHSPNWDEAGHLPAGISHWHLGRFEMYRVNPPLVRTVATTLVCLCEPKTDWGFYEPKQILRSEFTIGLRFIEINGEDTYFYIALARWTCIPFSILGACLCFQWANELYGRSSGAVAACLWCVSPNVLAYGQMITPDVAVTSLGLAANYTFWRWLKQPTWGQAAVAGTLVGLALLTKMTWILLFALLPIVWLFWRVSSRVPTTSRWSDASQLALMLLVGIFVINCGYGFEGTFARLGDYRFNSRLLAGSDSGHNVNDIISPRNRFADGPFRSMPVPLPRNYVLGLDELKYAVDARLWSYLRGEWRFGGWYHYYAYAMLVKVPLGTWLVILTSMVTIGYRAHDGVSWRDELVLLAPGIVVFALASWQLGFNHHLRYVLPLFPCVFIWSSKSVSLPQTGSVLWRRWLVAVGLAATICSSLWIWPHSLSYFNEFAGGPWEGHRHLGGSDVDSNIDCGQDMLNLKHWLANHPEASDVRIAWMGPVSPALVGIESRLPPAVASTGTPSKENGPEPGWYAISVSNLHRRTGEYDYFLRLQPTAAAGYSIYIYHVTLDDANRLRRELRLPELIDPML